VSIVDLREAPPASPIESDVCVIGAGAAGLTVATELGRAGLDVVLLESGGLAPEEGTQALNDLKVTGYPVRENFMSRARYYGGSCNLWAGRSMRLTPEDIAPEADPERVGWPLSYVELSEWYPAAGRVLRLPDIGLFEATQHRSGLSPVERALFDSGLVTPTVSLWARGPMRVGAARRVELSRSSRVRVLLHGNALRLRTAPDGRAVAALDAAVLHGPVFELRARRFVVACGGVENARLLLLSNLGNEHDLAGRYFMDHPRAVFGRVRLARGARLPYLRGRPVADGKLQLGIGVPSQIRRSQGLLNHYATLESEFSGYTAAGYQSLIKTAKVVLQKGYTGSRWEVGRSRLGDIPGLIYLLTPKELMPHPLYRLYWATRSALHPRPDGRARVIVYFCEQPPDRESRVVLAEARDAFGQPKAELRWRIGPEVTQSLLALQERLAVSLRSAGIGAVEPGAGEPRYTDASHHMGTTRMSRDPRLGVVDPHCRVHGLANLYVAGSSVFPTAGHANPTPTIIALALRLADHLRRA
jgi:GMC oxidoreductase/FAD binding domain-containing protein